MHLRKLTLPRTGLPCLVLTLLFVLLQPSFARAKGVQIRFSLDTPTAGPFPSNLFTASDLSHNTGLRINLPLSDCAIQVTNCNFLNVINTLDGFNLQPRVSIPFSGLIDPSTVTGDTLFLISMGSTLADGSFGGQIIGINQLVWDPDTNTLHVESDKVLKQHTRYALIVTREVRDQGGDRIDDKAFDQFRKQLKKQTELRWYHEEVEEALAWARFHGWKQNEVAAVSVFTTQSATAILEKIRDQIKADTPVPADFLIGPGRARTVFPVNTITSITFNRQTGTAPAFTPAVVPLAAFGFAPGAVGQLAYGKYYSPNYQTPQRFIPPVGTHTGSPEIQGINELFFTLFLPSSPKPPNGWPVTIVGHGNAGTKDIDPFFFAPYLAARGVATITINTVGHGSGPLGSLTVLRTDGSTVSFPSGGRGLDTSGDGVIGPNEGNTPAPPRGIISNRDALRQTITDLMQLVHMTQVGLDVDGDTIPDLDPAHLSFWGVSQGGMYGTDFLAVEPDVRVGVASVTGGLVWDSVRLSPTFRPLLELSLALQIPPLTNVGDPNTGDLRFNENLPLRDQPLVINDVPGALAIQEFLERAEWVYMAADPVAYAPHLRKQPLENVPEKSVIYQFARGDQNVPNPNTTALLRAGELTDSALLYRHDLAFADPARNPTGTQVTKNPHLFLVFNPGFFPAVADVGAGGRLQGAEFLASDGASVIDPDGPDGPLFEVPIVPPLPEDLGYIP